MDVVAVGWCRRKWLRLYQTIRNLTSGDMGTLLVVIQQGVPNRKRSAHVSHRPVWRKRGEGAV